MIRGEEINYLDWSSDEEDEESSNDSYCEDDSDIEEENSSYENEDESDSDPSDVPEVESDDEEHELLEVFGDNVPESTPWFSVQSKNIDVDAMYMKNVFNYFKDIQDPIFQNIKPYLDNDTEDDNIFPPEEQFVLCVRELTMRLQNVLSPTKLKESMMLLNCYIILAPHQSLCSFAAGVVLTAIYRKVKEDDKPETLQICMTRSQYLSTKSTKIIMLLIGHDVACLNSSFKVIRRYFVYFFGILPSPTNLEKIEFMDNIIPSIKKIYMDLIYDPETIGRITDPEFVKILLRLLNSEKVDSTEKHSLLEILSIMACNSGIISQILMKEDSVEMLSRFIGTYKKEETFMMDFASLIWAILPATPYLDTRTFDMHEKMRAEKIRPYRSPIWYWEASEGSWIPFSPGLNYAIEHKHIKSQEEFLYVESGVLHTINFKTMKETSADKKTIRRNLSGYCRVLPLRKTKRARICSFVTGQFSKFAYGFLCGRIYNTFNNSPERYRCWEGLFSLLRCVTDKQLSKLPRDPDSWTHDLLREVLKDMLYDECYHFRILSLEMLSDLMSRDPKKYNDLFENEGITTAIRRIGQASEAPISSDVADRQDSFDTLKERKIWLRDQARKFMEFFEVKNINVPEIGCESKMSDLEKIPIDILHEVLMSTPSKENQPESGRLQVLRYFIHFLTSPDGPKDRKQRLKEFLEFYANIPQNSGSKDLKISDGLFSELLIKLTDIVNNFLFSKSSWLRRISTKEIYALGGKILRKFNKNPLKLTVCSGNRRIPMNVRPFVSIQYLENFLLHKHSRFHKYEYTDRVVDCASFRAELHMNGKRIPSNITIFEAIRSFGVDIDDEKMFRMTHIIQFLRKARCNDPVREFVPSSTPLEHHLRERSPCPEIPEDVRMALQFIDILYGLNEYWTTLYSSYEHQYIIHPNKFISEDWDIQIERISMDPFCTFTGKIQSLVRDVVENCPFGLSLETRELVFRVCLERRRALITVGTPYYPYNNHASYPKVEVRRSLVLSDIRAALGSIRSYASWKVTFEDEVGSGEGLNDELFTMASRNLQKADLQIWAASEVTETGYIKVDEGLYPAAGRKVNKSRTDDGFLNLALEDKFETIGRFLGKALLEGHLLDLPLALPIFKWLLNQENQLNLEDLKYVNPSIYKVLKNIEKMAEKYEKIKNDPNLSDDAQNDLIKNINVDGETVDSYYLDFVVPGAVSIIELIPNGANIPVTLENGPFYVEKVTDFLLKSGVEKQMNSLKTGFDTMIDLDELMIFRPEELISLIYGEDNEEYWSIEHMGSNVLIVGFENSDKSIVLDLFKLWSSLSTERRLLFLQFITGCSRLPVGGFKSLNPPLRIVCCNQASAYAQTCFNTLYMPADMTNTQLEKFIDLAISEGLNCFGIV